MIGKKRKIVVKCARCDKGLKAGEACIWHTAPAIGNGGVLYYCARHWQEVVEKSTIRQDQQKAIDAAKLAPILRDQARAAREDDAPA